MSESFLLLAAVPAWTTWLACPTFWGLLAAVVGLYLLVPPHTRRRQVVGGAVAWIGLLLIIADMVALQWPVAAPAPHVVFWVLAAIAIAGGVGLISAQSPIYSAMWFALSLLGVAALFLQQDAQFLGIATIIVYAGAIVVTFLFVLMLAQPEGHSTADRISWGTFPKFCAVVLAGTLVGTVSQVIHPPVVVAAEAPVDDGVAPLESVTSKPAAPPGSLRDQLAEKFPELAPRLVNVELAQPTDGAPQFTLVLRDGDELGVDPQEVLATLEPIAAGATLTTKQSAHNVQAVNHMANLGGYLFSRYLIAVELAGTLLLAALVGAVSMIIQGRLNKEGEAHE